MKKWIYVIVVCVLSLWFLSSGYQINAINKNLNLPENIHTVVEIQGNEFHTGTYRLQTANNQTGGTIEIRLPIRVIHASWSTPIPSTDVIVLIPSSTIKGIDHAEINTIDQWITQHKIVLFYGNNVIPKSVIQAFHLPILQATITSNESLHDILYGYGYSKKYKAYLPVFLETNTKTYQAVDIVNFIYGLKKNFM